MALKFKVLPRCVPPVVAARRLGLTLDEFAHGLKQLRLDGFPAANVAGTYDLVAIDAWLDRCAGLRGAVAPADHDAVIRARLDAL